MRPCVQPGCPTLVERGRCAVHQRAYERRRPSARERGYDSRWAAASRAFRARHPLCGMLANGDVDVVNSWCAKEGRTTPAECVQHIVPHSGPNDPLLWDETNWLASCLQCNNRRRATEPGAFGR